MARHQIVTVGQSAALLLPPQLLAQLQVQIGDEVDVTILEHTLILRSLAEIERQEHLDAVVDRVFARRKDAYQRLAQESPDNNLCLSSPPGPCISGWQQTRRGGCDRNFFEMNDARLIATNDQLVEFFLGIASSRTPRHDTHVQRT